VTDEQLWIESLARIAHILRQVHLTAANDFEHYMYMDPAFFAIYGVAYMLTVIACGVLLDRLRESSGGSDAYLAGIYRRMIMSGALVTVGGIALIGPVALAISPSLAVHCVGQALYGISTGLMIAPLLLYLCLGPKTGGDSGMTMLTTAFNGTYVVGGGAGMLLGGPLYSAVGLQSTCLAAVTACLFTVVTSESGNICCKRSGHVRSGR
jgi:MFS family permease